MQNLPRGSMLADAFKLAYEGAGGSDDEDDVYDTDGEEFGVSLRSRIVAAPGKVLLAGDLAAIEPRCLTYMAGDFDTLELARTAPDADWYDARARAWGLYNDPLPLKKGAPDLRAVVKQLEIGLGYGMGIDVYAKKTGLSFDEAARNHANYQRWNPKVVEFWRTLERGLQASAGTSFDVILPSGRMVRFRGVSHARGKLSFLRLSHAGYIRQAIHPGFATENLVQALARDIYMDRVLAVARAGFNIVMRVHDEIVCEVDEDKAEQEKVRLHGIMSTSPSWIPRLPLAAGVEYGKTYAEAK
jgi:DNA polymerase